jgi:hypothetical protein
LRYYFSSTFHIEILVWETVISTDC